MSPAVILFFLPLLLALLFGWLLPGLYQPPLFQQSGPYWASGLFWTVLALVAAMTVLAILEVIWFERLEQPFGPTGWLVYGDGRAVIAGIIAGLLTSAVINLLSAPNPLGAASAVTLPFAPVVTIAVLYFLAVPGALDRIGLTTVKLGAVELTRTTGTGSVLPASATSQFSPAVSGSIGSPLNYQPLYDLTGLDGPRDSHTWEQNSFFQREAIFLNRMMRGKPGSSAMQAAILRQEDMVQWFYPLVRCGGAFRRLFPDTRDIAQIVAPPLQELISVNEELQALVQIVGHPSQSTKETQIKRSISDLGRRLTTDTRRAIIRMWLRIPRDLPTKCDRLPPGHFPSNLTDASEVSLRYAPPYLAIFAAHAYAATRSYDSGLLILDRWLSGHKPQTHDPAADELAWQRTQAVLQYSLIQTDASAGITLDVASLATLRMLVSRLADEWKIDLRTIGYSDCPPNRNWDSKPTDEEIDEHLAETFANAIERYLHARVDNRGVPETEIESQQDRRYATGLQAFAGRCLGIETDAPQKRRQRQALARFEAARTMSRWAIDGPREGLLSPIEATEERKSARLTMITALQQLRSLEKHEEEAEDGNGDDRLAGQPLPVGVGSFTQYRREAEREILDLTERLSHSP